MAATTAATVTVQRVDFGYFVRPAGETGTGAARVEPCLGYLVRHPQGVLLFDTGMGSHPDVDAHYRPRRRELGAALHAVGARPDEVGAVANCHLHFDHCGGNPQLGSAPVFVQRTELDSARNTADYTLPELIDGSRFEPVSGQAEVLPGILLLPTPGHTAGHQSLIVQQPDGSVIVAGQSHGTATEFAADHLAWHTRTERPAPDGDDWSVRPVPAWVEVLEQFDPRLVYFAHDRSVWVP